MTAEMFGYFDKVELYLVTGAQRCDVISEGKGSARAEFKDGKGDVVLVLDFQQVRDVLDAMRKAKLAAGLVNDELPSWRRDRKDD